MAKRKYTAEEIVTVLRQVEVAFGDGKTTPQACRPSLQAIRDLLSRPGDACPVAEGAYNVVDGCRPTIPNTGD
jgi:hypothetical protein